MSPAGDIGDVAEFMNKNSFVDADDGSNSKEQELEEKYASQGYLETDRGKGDDDLDETMRLNSPGALSPSPSPGRGLEASLCEESMYLETGMNEDESLASARSLMDSPSQKHRELTKHN